MALDRKAKWSCLRVIVTFVAGLAFCSQPTSSVAHATPKASPTSNCEGLLGADPPAEKPTRERGLKNERHNTRSSRSCPPQRRAQEPAADRWQGEKGRVDDLDLDVKMCPFAAVGKACGGPARLSRLNNDPDRFGAIKTRSWLCQLPRSRSASALLTCAPEAQP